MEPYFRIEFAAYAKSVIDFFYDEANPDNKYKELIFSKETLKCSTVTAYARITQGARYLGTNIDKTYLPKIKNLRISRTKTTLSIRRKDNFAILEDKGKELFAQTAETGLVSIRDSRIDKTTEVVEAEDGEKEEIDISIGDAEWKNRLFEFVENAQTGDVLDFDDKLILSYSGVKAVRQLLDSLSGVGQFTIILLDKSTLKIVCGTLEDAGLGTKKIEYKINNIYIEGKTIKL